jgi:hypothetical protein
MEFMKERIRAMHHISGENLAQGVQTEANNLIYWNAVVYRA